jgi:peptidyl-prolyl cis-trans isomerase B (cyclophilin B)
VPSRKSTEREAREARERLRRYSARQAVNAEQKRRRTRDNLIAPGALLIIAALAGASQVFYFTSGPGAPAPTSTASAPPVGQNVGDVPDPSLAQGKTWSGTMGLNDVTLGISLDGALAPQAVSSFLASVTSDYYVGKTCHRLVVGGNGGLIQCGSLDGNGGSDPNYSFGPVENPGAGGIYPAGTIAMARGGNNAYSQGRQFFIVFDTVPLPDDSAGGYTIIGQVTSGLDALKSQIADAGTADGKTDGPPFVPTTITKLAID